MLGDQPEFQRTTPREIAPCVLCGSKQPTWRDEHGACELCIEWTHAKSANPLRAIQAAINRAQSRTTDHLAVFERAQRKALAMISGQHEGGLAPNVCLHRSGYRWRFNGKVHGEYVCVEGGCVADNAQVTEWLRSQLKTPKPLPRAEDAIAKLPDPKKTYEVVFGGQGYEFVVPEERKAEEPKVERPKGPFEALTARDCNAKGQHVDPRENVLDARIAACASAPVRGIAPQSTRRPRANRWWARKDPR